MARKTTGKFADREDLIEFILGYWNSCEPEWKKGGRFLKDLAADAEVSQATVYRILKEHNDGR